MRSEFEACSRRCVSAAALRLLALGVLALGAACRQDVAVNSPAVNAPTVNAPTVQAPNLIQNGDFELGIAPWGAHTTGDAGHALEPRLVGGALCTAVQAGEEVIVGWPVSGSADSFALVAGERYELSLRASVSGAAAPECVIKVGHQLAPYTGAFTTKLPLGPALAPFGVTFAPDHADDRAGLALECRGAPGSAPADVCIDDVSLSLSVR